jgi:hypothetical protein
MHLSFNRSQTTQFLNSVAPPKFQTKYGEVRETKNYGGSSSLHHVCSVLPTTGLPIPAVAAYILTSTSCPRPNWAPCRLLPLQRATVLPSSCTSSSAWLESVRTTTALCHASPMETSPIVATQLLCLGCDV